MKTSTTTSQPYLKKLAISNFNSPHSDKGSGASKDVTFWYPTFPVGWYALGWYAANNYSSTPHITQFVYQVVNDDPNNPVFKQATAYPQLWSDQLTICSMTPPDGYIALGSCGQPGGGGVNLMCVRQDFCEKIPVSNLVWNDSGSGQPTDVSVWQLPSSAAVIATLANGYPSSEQVWDLKTTALLES